MGEILPDGTIQGYFGKCKVCGKEIPVNIQGSERGEHSCVERLQQRLATAEADLTRCYESKTKISDRCLALETERDRLKAEVDRLTKLGEERHVRAKDTEEGLMEHIERLQTELQKIASHEAYGVEPIEMIE